MQQALALYIVLTVLDVLIAWVQPDPRLWPRRATHLLTEPPQALIRRLLPRGGWDLSPLVVVALCGLCRLWSLQP